MVQRASFSHDRLQRLGKEAAERARRKENLAHSVVLTCEYIGTPIAEGRYDAKSTATENASFAFQWHAKAGSIEAMRVTTVRCDHLADRGVPFPQGWRVALQNLDLDEIVAKGLERVILQSRVHSVRCQLLGKARHAEVSDV